MQTRRTITAVAAVVVITTVASTLELLVPFDNALLDIQLKFLRSWHSRPTTRDVVVVGVDEETVRRFPEPVGLWHRQLAAFLRAMIPAKPDVLGVDIVLPDRSFESVMPGSDKTLLKAMLDARQDYPFVLAVTVDEAGKPRPIYPPYLSLAGPAGWGYALFPMDGDGRVRRFDERLGASSEELPTLVGQMARKLGVQPHAGWIDYSLGNAIRYVPLHEVLKWAEDRDYGALSRTFGGKPVLLGTVLPFTDRQRVSVPLTAWESAMGDVPGVVLHAQALRTILSGGLIRPVANAAVLTGVICGALLWLAGKAVMLSALIFGAVMAALLLTALLFTAQGLFLPVAAPMLAAGLALGGRSAVETASRLRERRRLRRSFAGYVSPAVMDEILSGRVRPELGGASVFVCVLFSDIRGYTARTESMTPQETIRFLNRYFDRVVTLIHSRGGSVMSFIGDGIMAVFGAPNRLDDPCRAAVDAGKDMLRHVEELNAQLKDEGIPPVEIGIGVHAGEAVIGHVGSSARHDYTAIGDVINVASRIEGLTKETGCRMVLSAGAARFMIDGDVPLTRLGPMAIKGHAPVEVYGYDESRSLGIEQASLTGTA